MKKFSHRAVLMALLLGVSLILSACGGDTATPAPTATTASGAAPTSAGVAPSGGGKTVVVEEKDFEFSPKEITINVGDTVEFKNTGGAPHTAQAADGSWDSGNQDPGSSFKHTFTAPGSVAYFCKYHGSKTGSGMAGTITVAAGSVGGATPAATATTTASQAPATTATTATQASGGQGQTVTVEEQDFKFSPKDITINVGDTIEFKNTGGAPHTAQAADGSWDSGNQDPGSSFSHTFTDPGTIVYFCKYHGSKTGSGMAGTITVKAAGVGAGGATPTAMAAMTATQGTAASDTVAADDQPAGGTVMVKHIYATQDGFIVIHANTADNKPGEQLGHIQVKAGDNENVAVPVSPATKAGDKVWPMLHIDAGTIGTYEFPGPDAPVIINGNIVMKQITLTAPVDTVAADDQPAGGTVMVKHIYATQDGFIVIHANTADNKPGEQLGHIQVKAGDNENVAVPVSPATKAGDKVWPMLHIDAGTIGTYEFPGPDAPVIINGNIVMKQITLTAPPVMVELLDNRFSLTDITINAGDTIMFVNKGVRAHTVTAADGAWDSGNMDAGASFSHTFTKPGVIIVYCKYHGSADGKGMAAAITVVQSSGAATPQP